ncbi:hypothetical protein NMY22_g15241 [Coprinellus aureogranulatus]|nr:hypothetical protein NMY22_g15241 [Coprinellus aureogranulatus]
MAYTGSRMRHGLIELDIPKDDQDPPTAVVEVRIVVEDPVEGREIYFAVACDMEEGTSFVDKGPREGACVSCMIRALPPAVMEGEKENPWDDE